MFQGPAPLAAIQALCIRASLLAEGSDGIIRKINLPTLRELGGDTDDYILSIYSRHLKPTFYFVYGRNWTLQERCDMRRLRD